jgi:hypothetical protein
MIIDKHKLDDAPILWHCFLPPAHPFWRLTPKRLFDLFGAHTHLHKTSLIPIEVEGKHAVVMYLNSKIPVWEPPGA